MSLESLDFSGIWEATVEMKDARRRELTLSYSIVVRKWLSFVEMEEARRRELTHFTVHPAVWHIPDK